MPPTGIYDCESNRWQHPQTSTVEPPPRCNAPIVFDPATKQMVMFGGFNQAAALSELWSYDCEKQQWSERKPALMPPPMEAPAATVLSGGKVLVCGNDASQVRSSAEKQTWIYDMTKNEWKSVSNQLELQGYSWLTAAIHQEKGIALMVAFGSDRRTYTFRYDPRGEHIELSGVKQSGLSDESAQIKVY